MAQAYIITGDKASGKTTRCLDYVAGLKILGYSVGGFVASGEIEKDKRSRIFLQNLKTTKRIEFAQRKEREEWEQIKSFYFNPEAISIGEEWLKKHLQNSDFLFIDEVGLFDVQGKIWGAILHELMNSSVKLVLSIRDIFVEEVVKHFKIEQYKIVTSLEDFL